MQLDVHTVQLQLDVARAFAQHATSPATLPGVNRCSLREHRTDALTWLSSVTERGLSSEARVYAASAGPAVSRASSQLRTRSLHTERTSTACVFASIAHAFAFEGYSLQSHAFDQHSSRGGQWNFALVTGKYPRQTTFREYGQRKRHRATKTYRGLLCARRPSCPAKPCQASGSEKALLMTLPPPGSTPWLPPPASVQTADAPPEPRRVPLPLCAASWCTKTPHSRGRDPVEPVGTKHAPHD